jgi:hypothetical protein
MPQPPLGLDSDSYTGGSSYFAYYKRIPVILKRSLRERNNWRIRLGLVVG